MISLNAIPKSTKDIVGMHFDFPRLEPDSPSGCPYSMAEIRRYLAAEDAPGRPRDLFFGRTALVGGVRFWLWGYVEEGETCFVDVSERDGEMTLAMGSGEGLTPEQYIALRYARRLRDR